MIRGWLREQPPLFSSKKGFVRLVYRLLVGSTKASECHSEGFVLAFRKLDTPNMKACYSAEWLIYIEEKNDR